ncbi:MAG TPA: hypothetical protein DD618_00135 [Acholeplasmatales bacterium]|nr:hypothetical protein [Acholeplasmatales bacterium]
MDIEKMVNSKWYQIFEWGYRLLFLNLLSIAVPSLVASLPFIFWYFHQDSGWLMLLTIVLWGFGFLPCFIAAFSVIKDYKEDKTGNVFVLFFVGLWKAFKDVYKLDLIVTAMVGAGGVGAIFYWDLLSGYDTVGPSAGTAVMVTFIVSVVGFVVLFFLLIAIFLAVLQLPMIVANFRMKTWNLIKFSLYMAFRYFFKTLAYAFLMIGPILLVGIFQSKILPIYMLYGISLPLFGIYLISAQQYWHLSHNLENLKAEMELKGDKNETGD